MYQTSHGTKAVIFDLDDTLAPSKSPLDPSMATALVSLLRRVGVCIISGGRFEQFQAQVLDRLTAPEQVRGRLQLMPTNGTRYYSRQHGTWSQIYAENLSREETARITQ